MSVCTSVCVCMSLFCACFWAIARVPFALCTQVEVVTAKHKCVHMSVFMCVSCTGKRVCMYVCVCACLRVFLMGILHFPLWSELVFVCSVLVYNIPILISLSYDNMINMMCLL